MRVSEGTLRSLAWQERALCRDRSGDDFFPETRPKVKPRDLCEGCEVIGECLSYAISVEAVGIWGGTSTKERSVMVRQRRHLPATRRPADIETWLAS